MRCYKCGREFACGMEGPAPDDARCWCAQFPPLKEIQPQQGCLCAACLRDDLTRENGQSDTA